MDANKMYDTITRELNNLVISDTDEAKEEQESFSFHEEAQDSDDIPPSLLSYFETSKSRAAVYEKLILEELEDFTASHHTEDTMNLPFELDKDMMKLNEQVICDTENENSTSTDTRLLPAPTETEALFSHNVSVCPNNEDEYMESERQLALEYETEREKRRCEEMKKEEQKRQIERDFQRELKTVKEAEKLHQMELELMGKRAQEKLEQELLLQQELMSNLQRRVEEERRMLEEEQRRMKDEEDNRKREEKKIKMEAERKRMEEEMRRKKEEERKTEEMKLKKEEEEKRRMEREEKKRREEEQKRMKDEEDNRKREEEKIRMEVEGKRIEEERKIEEMQLKKEEEEKRRMESEEKKRREEEQKRMKDEEDNRKREEEKIKMEAERKRVEEEMRRKKAEERKIEEMKEDEEKKRMEREEKKRREEERNKIILEKKKLEDELKMKEEEERKKKEEGERIKKEEEKGKREEEIKKIEEAKKKMEKEKRKMREEMSLKKEEEEEEERTTKEIEERKKQEEMRKRRREKEALKNMHEEVRKRDERDHGNIDEEMKEEEEEEEKSKKKKKMEEEKNEVKEVVRKKEGENRTMKEEQRSIEEDEKRRKEDERKNKEEEQGRRQKEEMRQEDKDGYRKSEEMTLKEDEQGYKRYNRKMKHENKIKDKEKKQDEEEEKLVEEERKKELRDEEVGENKEVKKKTEEIVRFKDNEESKTRTVPDREKEVRVVNVLPEKRENNSMMGQNENKNTDKTENSLASQLEDITTWTSSSPAPSHSESTISSTSTETEPQQHDLEENTSQISTDKTGDCENQPARPPAVSVFLPVCLPEHTEKKRLSWMKDCVPWSKLSLQNRRKQKGSVRSRRGLRGAAEASSLPPLCPDSLLQSTGWKSLQEVTTVTLEDLPGCSLSTLAQCTQLRSLTLRRCGLKSLEGINQLPQLCFIDVQENDIAFVDCENMTSLRVLQLGHNKLTSIHGLTGADNLDVLDLSHNSITRIAGLESMRSLQRLSVDHNQLISTKGLRDIYTLLHLNCSHNHLASVEGLENSALLNTLDLRANSLTEPPSLNNQVLLRELHLDDNSISSLQGLTACWLPLMQNLSVAQNRITQLPSMSDFVSLANLDLRFNCMSELQNVCESLEGCQFLREVHLTGNPLQRESGWRSTLLKAVPGLRAIDGRETDSFLTPPAVQRVSSASGSFLMFCQAQLQQTRDLQQQHSKELSNASSTLDAVKTSFRHFTEALQLAKDQRFAHEYGDTTVADTHRATGQTAAEETLYMGNTNAEKRTERPEMESTEKVEKTFEETSAAEIRHDTFDTATSGPKTVSRAGSVRSSVTKEKTTSSNLEKAPASNHQDLQNAAAVVIQQLWRKYRQKCGNFSSPSTAERGGGRGGDGAKPESGPSNINRSVAGKDHAATVIQAFWRGFTLRRRLASALAAVTCPDTGEDDTFEEVDVDEFVFDEVALEKHWTLSLSEDSPPRRYPVSEQPLPLKPPVHFPELSQYILPPPLVWKPKQAWLPGEQVDSAGQRVSPESSSRSKSPASTSVFSGLSERSDKILEEWGFTNSRTALLMLRRAQKMKATKQQQKKDPSVRLALFRNCSYQLAPVEARNRPAQHNRNYIKVREAELGLQQAERVERAKQGRAQRWLHTQAAHCDRDSESVHFLPEISSDILNGGRVQLVADPGYTECLHHADGLWANNSLAAQPCKESSFPRRNSLGHARKEVPSPQRVTSAPSKKERISFRDNPVQLSGGWGGGKKRDKVYK